MSFATLAVTKSGHVAEIRLSRHAGGNPIDARFLDELDQAAASIHEYADIHVALLTADGDSFSRGASDGTVIPSPDRLPFRCLELMAQPVIACIQGDASAPAWSWRSPATSASPRRARRSRYGTLRLAACRPPVPRSACHASSAAAKRPR